MTRNQWLYLGGLVLAVVLMYSIGGCTVLTNEPQPPSTMPPSARIADPLGQATPNPATLPSLASTVAPTLATQPPPTTFVGRLPIPSLRPPTITANSQRVAAEVARVIDGDTIVVAMAGIAYRVRYIGIDAPEMVAPGRPVAWMGPEASAANKTLVEHKTVYLEKDISEMDRYGRLLRYVYVGDLFVNAELVREGYAQVSTWPPDVKYQSLFLQEQREARETGRGLWMNTAGQIKQAP